MEAESSFMVLNQISQSFSLDQIQSATQNFNEALVIGQGGFGKVYKGFINKDDDVVAIKRSSSISNQGALQFRAEVEMLSKIRHCNLVSLIGYCNEGTEMALVYEYMPQGSLADHLHKAGGCLLPWLQLLKICIEAARGLDYLHTGTGTQHGIIHRDVKSSNVLLDSNFAAKISDFGLAKISPINQTRTHVSTVVKGTFGYLDPCYVYTGELTRKSDVYSFGVLLLEVICGRPAVDTSLDEDKWGLAPWAQDCIKQGKWNHIVDSKLKGQISSNCLKDFVRVASKCLHNQPNQRPTMAEIVGRLEIILSLQKRLDSSISEGKFIGKVWSFFQAKVESNDKVNTAMVPRGKHPLIQTSGSAGNLKSFSYDVLRVATRNFRGDRNFGSVFKGWIDEASLEAVKPGSGTVIAVRRTNEPVCEGDHHEWLAKNNYLGLLNHPNLVKLIGCCVEDGHRFQVCEFMPRGSLENYLFQSDPNFKPLTWNLLIKIILGAAKGLAYLHAQESKTICCNIKSDNILVDSDYNGKLSNFWLQEDVTIRCDTFNTWKVVDSNYAAPEYVATGCSTARSDVYSFGVVLLQVLTGKPHIINHRRRKYATAYRYMKRGMHLIMGHGHHNVNNKQMASALAKKFCRCILTDPGDRPTADEVVRALEKLQALQKADPSTRESTIGVVTKINPSFTPFLSPVN